LRVSNRGNLAGWYSGGRVTVGGFVGQLTGGDNVSEVKMKGSSAQ